MFSPENPWNFFKEIFVLNLPHRTDRREHIKKQLSRFPNLEYTLFKAVHGKRSKYAVGYSLFRKIITLEPNPDGEIINLGQLGCIISHYLIWEQCLLRTEEEGWILILEDDVEFHPDFTNEKMYEYLTHLPPDAKYFKLGYQDADKYSNLTPVNSYWNHLGGKTFSTIAYAIHTDYLMPFLTNTFQYPLDWYPLEYAYGMIDLSESKDNEKDDFFRYFYFSENKEKNIIYQNIGIYRGVVRSFQYELDSDINEFAQQRYRVNHLV